MLYTEGNKMAKRLTGRKRSKKSLEWQLDQASSLHFDLINIRLRLDEIPDVYLPQAPLARATLELLSGHMRTWQERIQADLEAQAEEPAPKKATRRRKKKIT